MTFNGAHSRKAASSRTLRVFGLVVLCVTALLAVLFWYRWLLRFRPPDLSGCTRIEITYYPSALRYLVPGMSGDSLFSRAEKAYLESFETFTTSDEERIRAFAVDLSLGSYNGRRSIYGPAVYVTCYRDERPVGSFYVLDQTVISEHEHRFNYPTGFPNLEAIEPPRMRRFKLRCDCARNMGGLQAAGPLLRRKVSSYPDPNQWCDAIGQFCRNQYDIWDGVKKRRFTERWISEVFVCPSVRERVYEENSQSGANEPHSPENVDPSLLECHYAMNPYCEPNSAPDTVLLFETKTGWNQHGGPELFTFDNHDPKGGCVLLNDGTIRFIRTKEELTQLRWK